MSPTKNEAIDLVVKCTCMMDQIKKGFVHQNCYVHLLLDECRIIALIHTST
jgi:hypothetical protein